MSEAIDISAAHLVGWSALVAVTLALLPLGRMQRRMLREGRLSSASLPRAKTYAQAALQWLVLGSLALWVVGRNPAPFDLSAFRWPDGPEGLLAFAVVGALLAALLRWSRRLPHSRRDRAWLRAVYRHGASLIAPRTLDELARFRAAAWPAAALSALLFGVAHSWQGGAVMAWTTVFGLVAAALTLHSGSVWPAIALHVGWNLIVGGMMHTVYRRRGLTS